MGIFMEEWLALYQSKSGERGIFNREAAEKHIINGGRRISGYQWGCNPCSEIILRNGQFCNLSEAVIRHTDTLEDIRTKVINATILGTMQATLTDFKGLRKKWKRNTEEEALLGVSLTGINDNVFMQGNKNTKDLKSFLTELKNITIATNAEWSKKLGYRVINITTNPPNVIITKASMDT